MRYFVLIWSLLVAITFASAQSITLNWQYSSNTLALADTNGWPFTFKVYCTNLVTAPMPWPVIYSQPASNTPVTAFDGTNYTFSVTNPTAPGQAFFVATVSNIWGESGNSNTSSVPPLPMAIHTKILKN